MVRVGIMARVRVNIRVAKYCKAILTLPPLCLILF